eukprot:30925-Pelagococcus_subviridis.AAC.3
MIASPVATSGPRNLARRPLLPRAPRRLRPPDRASRALDAARHRLGAASFSARDRGPSRVVRARAVPRAHAAQPLRARWRRRDDDALVLRREERMAVLRFHEPARVPRVGGVEIEDVVERWRSQTEEEERREAAARERGRAEETTRGGRRPRRAAAPREDGARGARAGRRDAEISLGARHGEIPASARATTTTTTTTTTRARAPAVRSRARDLPRAILARGGGVDRIRRAGSARAPRRL